MNKELPVWPWEILSALSRKGWLTVVVHWILAAAMWTTAVASAYLYETSEMKPETPAYLAWGIAIFFGIWGLIILLSSVAQFRRNWDTNGDLWKQ